MVRRVCNSPQPDTADFRTVKTDNLVSSQQKKTRDRHLQHGNKALFDVKGVRAEMSEVCVLPRSFHRRYDVYFHLLSWYPRAAGSAQLTSPRCPREVRDYISSCERCTAVPCFRKKGRGYDAWFSRSVMPWVCMLMGCLKGPFFR